MPESAFHVTSHQRGSTLRLLIAISRFEGASTALTSNPINLSNLVSVAAKCKSTASRDIEVSVNIIKGPGVRECEIQITCENYSKLISLSEPWVEVVILATREYDRINKYFEKAGNVHAYLYFIDATITVLQGRSTPMLLINKQLYNDAESTDFQLTAGDGSVPVHKAVLFIHSDMFRTMFRGEWKETTEGQIKVDGVTAKTLQHLKNYMYLGTLPDEGLEPLLLLADRYFIDKLKEQCISKLVKTMKPENLDDIIDIAFQNNIRELVRVLIMETPDCVITKVHEIKIDMNKIKEE